MVTTTMTDCSVLRHAVSRLADIAAGNSKVSSADEDWLLELKNQFGAEHLKIAIGTIGGVHSSESIDLFTLAGLDRCASSPEALNKFLDGLKAILAAESYSPSKMKLGKITLPVHNALIARKLRSSYSVKQFQQLYEFCLARGVFQVTIDPENGLLQTSAGEENWSMSERRWVTDTVRCGDIERFLDPIAWRKALFTLCDFYNQPEELEAIEKSIADPNYYRQGDLTDGIAHIFMPHTLRRDPSWFNNKRLESHALALKAFCGAVLKSELNDNNVGLNDNTPEDKAQLIAMAQAISNLASYLKAVNTCPLSGNFDFSAPSAGPWEEIPFPEGLTWDTEATRGALESLSNLLFKDENRDELKAIRQAITDTKHGAWLKDPIILDKLIGSGKDKVYSRLFSGPEPIENPSRPIDISLAFISTSTIKLGDSVIDDVTRHFHLLAYIEKHLVRDNGAIRYAPFDFKLANGGAEKVFDSYLADNYWLFPQLRLIQTGQLNKEENEKDYGSTDCSTEEDYVARVKLARINTEAEWCWVSVIAEGYARQTVKLLDLAAAEERSLTAAERALVKQGQQKATEFINRSYTRITGIDEDEKPYCKANGKDCEPFAVPEAYEHVSPLDKTITTKALPGVNTPLAWGVASLFSASYWFRRCLEKMEHV